jgi:hypothetical protein
MHHFSGHVVMSHPHQDALRVLVRGAHAFPWQNGGLVLDDRVLLHFVGIVEQRAVTKPEVTALTRTWASCSARASTGDSVAVCIAVPGRGRDDRLPVVRVVAVRTSVQR